MGKLPELVELSEERGTHGSGRVRFDYREVGLSAVGRDYRRSAPTRNLTPKRASAGGPHVVTGVRPTG